MADMRKWLGRLGSVRLRITLAATLVFALAFAVASIALVRTVRASLEDDVRDDVMIALDDVAEQVADGEPPEAIGVPATEGVLYQVISPDGQVVGSSPGAGQVPFVLSIGGEALRPPATGERILEFERSTAGGDQLVSTREVDGPEGPLTVAVASPLEDIRRTVDTLGRTLWLGIPLLVALVAALVWFLVGRALRPVDAIRAEVEEISHTTMHRRVPVPASRDEVARLADTMNDMLDRLDQASARQRQFVSDASHELRSPLTTMHAALELGLRHADQADWPTVASTVLNEDRRMAGIIDDLLELSRMDENGAAALPVPVRLHEVTMEEIERLGDGRVDASGVSGGDVLGSRDQLGRVLRNLLANAARHAREQIVVALATDGDDVVFTVDDDGAGVPAEDRDLIFGRFTRLDAARTRDAGGSGLGLAIVRAAVTRHGGTVVVTDSPLGGARFVVRLPGVGGQR
jgi:signal transduction histidine kinase